VVLYGCETWSPTLREELRLKVFENRVLRRIFGLKRDEMTRGWRKLYNEEHSKCRIDKGLIEKGKHNRTLKVAVQGLDYYGPPLIHSFIHNEELHNLYFLPSIIRMMKSWWMRWRGHVTRMGAKRNAEGKKPLGRQRHRWLDNIKMDLREIDWVVLTGLIWLRIVTSGRFL
jgi:hypothetical protein